MTQLEFEDLLASDSYQTVSELSREIKAVLESALPGVWVQGEISNLTFHSSGHLYFSLKDKHAQISCVMWRSRNRDLYFTPQEGMKVLVKARLSLYEKRGVYQLDAWQMQPAGVGELQLAFDRLKKRLDDEGLFSAESKKPLPALPECIGIVTSQTGAAITDLVTVLRRRMPSIKVVLYPVKVQGDGAAREIAAAIETVNRYGKVDLLIVGRGGGSIEDLWAFNEEEVARAIFKSRIPVVSAVGHEVDFTISDFVADHRAATPSVAAELVICRRAELLAQLRYFQENMAGLLLERIRYEKVRLQGLQRSYGFRQPLDKVLQAGQRLDELSRLMLKQISHKLSIDNEILLNFRNRLTALSPEHVLKRGYALCYRESNGQHVAGTASLQCGEDLRIRFHEGQALAQVNKLLD